MRTFEEEMRSIIAKARFGTTINRYEEMPQHIQKEIDIAVNDVLAAHQAEMDRMVEEVIGSDISMAGYSRSGGIGYAFNYVNQIKAEQRARYKAMKEGK